MVYHSSDTRTRRKESDFDVKRLLRYLQIIQAICIVVCVGSSKSDFLSSQVLWSRV